MQVERLDHLVLTVKDIAATTDFYQTALGMKAGGIIRGRTHPIRNFVLGLFGLKVVDRS